MTTINLEELDREFEDGELDEIEAVEPTQIDTKENPFANMLMNMLEGGGRQRRQKISSK